MGNTAQIYRAVRAGGLLWALGEQLIKAVGSEFAQLHRLKATPLILHHWDVSHFHLMNLYVWTIDSSNLKGSGTRWEFPSSTTSSSYMNGPQVLGNRV